MRGAARSDGKKKPDNIIAKIVDGQAGLETGMGALVAALARDRQILEEPLAGRLQSPRGGGGQPASSAAARAG